MMEYVIIANLSFAVFYLFYIGIFKRFTFFHWNRVYLLTALAFSAIVPLIQIPSWSTASNAIPVFELPMVVISATNQPEFQPAVETAFWIYWVGVAVGLAILATAIWKIWRAGRKAQLEVSGKDKVLVSEGDHAFSFFTRIQIGAKIDREMKEMIVAHERVHKEQWHSVDVMLYACARILAWFNPFVHFAAKEVQLNHEFLADEATMREYGQDYQYSLLDQAFDTHVFRLTNAFFSKSIIKNRIVMMNKHKQGKWSMAVYGLIIPIIAGTIWLSSCSQEPGVPDSQQAVSMNDMVKAKPSETVLAKEDVDEMPSFPGGQEAMLAYFQEGFVYPEELKEEGVEGKVYLSFVVNEDGSLTDVTSIKSDDERLEPAGIEFVKGMPAWEPGTKDGVKVKVKMVLPLQYTMN